MGVLSISAVPTALERKEGEQNPGEHHHLREGRRRAHGDWKEKPESRESRRGASWLPREERITRRRQ